MPWNPKPPGRWNPSPLADKVGKYIDRATDAISGAVGGQKDQFGPTAAQDKMLESPTPSPTSTPSKKVKHAPMRYHK